MTEYKTIQECLDAGITLAVCMGLKRKGNSYEFGFVPTKDKGIKKCQILIREAAVKRNLSLNVTDAEELQEPPKKYVEKQK